MLDSIQNLKKREKIILAGVGAMVILYFFYTFFVSSLVTDVQNEMSKLNELKTKWSEIESMSLSSNALEKQAEKLRTECIVASRTVPDKPRLPEIIYNLKLLADAEHTNLKGVSPDEPALVYDSTPSSSTAESSNSNKALRGFMKLPVRISVQGNSAGLYNFIKKLESSGRVTLLESVESSKDERGAMKLDIKANFYYLDVKGIEDRPYDFDVKIPEKADLFK